MASGQKIRSPMVEVWRTRRPRSSSETSVIVVTFAFVEKRTSSPLRTADARLSLAALSGLGLAAGGFHAPLPIAGHHGEGEGVGEPLGSVGGGEDDRDLHVIEERGGGDVDALTVTVEVEGPE